jgi:eukaryotic-like serine/threonine-protein kinase
VSPPSRPATLARRYRLDEPLAEGGYGEVWRALDLVLNRAVAVKLLRAGYGGQPEIAARFRAEARHAGALCHENIARVYDYDDGQPGSHPPYLVMELVAGPSLDQLMAAGAPGPVRVMDIVAQTAAGLAVAHRAGLVHRDIKPGNLLLGPGGTVKITDFGIAHAVGSAPVTSTGTIVGTPAYLAPERAAGAQASPASDLYSLGVVAYECLAGAPPFTGSPLEIAAAHRERPMPPLPAWVPGEVAALVGYLTAKDPAARPGSAAEVARWAGRLRDALKDGTAGLLTGVPHHPAVLAAGRPTVYVPSPAPGGGRSGRRWDAWIRPGGLRARRLMAPAAVLVAALSGVVLASAGSPGSPQRAAHVPASTSTPRPVLTVVVSRSALIGEPARQVVRHLHRIGLRPRVQWRPSAQPAGSVLAVLPSGRLPAGSPVTVIVAVHRSQPEPARAATTTTQHHPDPDGQGHDRGHGHHKWRSDYRRHGDGGHSGSDHSGSGG